MLEKIIEKAIVDEIITPGSQKDKLDAVYMPPSSQEAIKLFKFMQNHIELQSNGMGVSLRHDRQNISSLLEKEGFDYVMVQDFIDEYESKLLNQHYEDTKPKD